jgi:hypothetical protein
VQIEMQVRIVAIEQHGELVSLYLGSNPLPKRSASCCRMNEVYIPSHLDNGSGFPQGTHLAMGRASASFATVKHGCLGSQMHEV